MVQINYDKILDEILQYIEISTFNGSIKALKDNFMFFLNAIKEKRILSASDHLQDALADLSALIHHLVLVMEKISEEMEDFDEDKREILVKFLDDQIDLPFYLEWIDDNIIRELIDEAVDYYNHMGWDAKKEIKKINTK
jgi:hypothetical protein